MASMPGGSFPNLKLLISCSDQRSRRTGCDRSRAIDSGLMLQLVYLLLGLAVTRALRFPGSGPKAQPVPTQSGVQPLPIAIYTSEVCVGHNPGSRMGQVLPEQPARLANLIAALRGPWAAEFGELVQVREPEVDVTEEQLRRIHTPEHLERIAAAFAQSRPKPPSTLSFRVNLDRDTVISEPGSEAAANRAAGLVVAAVDDLLGKPGPSAARRAFVMVRPPGHHAEADKAGGFCIFNNVMVGVAHAQAKYGLQRVAVLDFDVHHGNGGADICDAGDLRCAEEVCDATRMCASSAYAITTSAFSLLRPLLRHHHRRLHLRLRLLHLHLHRLLPLLLAGTPPPSRRASSQTKASSSAATGYTVRS